MNTTVLTIDHTIIDDSDLIVQPVQDYILVKLISDPIKSMLLVNKDLPEIQFKTIKVVSWGELVKVKLNQGDEILYSNVSVNDLLMGYRVPSHIATKSINSWHGDLRRLNNEEYKEFVKNYPTIQLVEYLVIPSHFITAIVNKK
jgi:hypothetical protein